MTYTAIVPQIIMHSCTHIYEFVTLISKLWRCHQSGQFVMTNYQLFLLNNSYLKHIKSDVEP